MRKEKILFVDEDLKNLKGIQRKLATHSEKWEMVFIGGGEEAVSIIEKQLFDIVITDIKLSKITGIQLLDRIRKSAPETVRIILSAGTSQDIAVKTAGIAHQFIQKPINIKNLIEIIENSLKVKRILSSDEIKTVLSRIGTLPAVPSVYQKLMEGLKRPDISLVEIGEIISKDIGMTTKVLQLVNSAFFGVPHRVTNPAQAASLLGLDNIKALVLGVGLFRNFREIRGMRISIDLIQRHSLYVASLAKKIGKDLGCDKRMLDYTFIAGFLHDIGILILMDSLRKDYMTVLENTEYQNSSVITEEYEQLGSSHAEIGAYLLGLWGLPYPVVEAVAFHHKPSIKSSGVINPMVLVYLANIVASDSSTSKLYGREPEMDDDLLRAYNIEDRSDEWCKIYESMKQISI